MSTARKQKAEGRRQEHCRAVLPFAVVCLPPSAFCLLAVAFCLQSVQAAEKDEDITERSATAMPLTAAEPRADTLAPPSQFSPDDGNAAWDDARRRAGMAIPGQGSGFFD